MSGDIAAAAESYARFWATLTPASAARVEDVFAEDVAFRDPFNAVRGRKAMAAVIAKTFADCDEPRFDMRDIAVGGYGTAYFRWRFTFRRKGAASGEPWVIEGMTEVAFDADGKVARHIDHWDAASQFYERIPLLGGVMRLIKRRMQV